MNVMNRIRQSFVLARSVVDILDVSAVSVESTDVLCAANRSVVHVGKLSQKTPSSSQDYLPSLKMKVPVKNSTMTMEHVKIKN